MLTSADVWERYDSVNRVSSPFPYLPLILIGVISAILIIILVARLFKHRKTTAEDRLLSADTIDEMPIDTFVDITDEQYKMANDAGCYILYNLDKEKYYVGKSPLCADAVNRQIIGKGNPDVFYEKKDGDEFTVQFYFIGEGSYYEDVEHLYDDVIEVYSENSEVIGI